MPGTVQSPKLMPSQIGITCCCRERSLLELKPTRTPWGILEFADSINRSNSLLWYFNIDKNWLSLTDRFTSKRRRSRWNFQTANAGPEISAFGHFRSFSIRRNWRCPWLDRQCWVNLAALLQISDWCLLSIGYEPTGKQH